MAERYLKVEIISPESEAFSGEAVSVTVPAHDGSLGILYGHAPMVVLLGTGRLVVEGPEGTHAFDVSKGFLQVVDNSVSALAESVNPA